MLLDITIFCFQIYDKVPQYLVISRSVSELIILFDLNRYY